MCVGVVVYEGTPFWKSMSLLADQTLELAVRGEVCGELLGEGFRVG